MPVYEFQAEDGEERDVWYLWGTAPHLGEWVELDGKRFQRVIRPPQIPSSKGGENFRLHSVAAPNLAAIEHQEKVARASKGRVPMPVRAPKYDEHGFAVFRSKKEVDDYAKRDGRYVFGDVHEGFHNAATKPAEFRSEQLAQMKENDRQSKIPEVK